MRLTPQEAARLQEIDRARAESLKPAYHALFTSPAGRTVLVDLIAFCHGRTSEFSPDPHVHAFNSGKRAVLMKIIEFTNLTVDEMYQLRGRPIAHKEDTDG